MQITLGEDDAILNNGIPKNVVLMVTFDDGKQIRIPYGAEKTIVEMYKQLTTLQPISKAAQNIQPIDHLIPKFIPVETVVASENKILIDKSNIIEREDIVTLVKVLPRGEGESVEHLILGQEYRVIKIYSSGVAGLPGTEGIQKVVHGYDIVNDKSPRPERIRVFPSEVAFCRKRKSPIPKVVGVIEEILACPNCKEMNACALDGDIYKGTCAQCKSPYQIERIIEKCPKSTCGNDVALFQTGDTYRGKCNKCGTIVEAEA